MHAAILAGYQQQGSATDGDMSSETPLRTLRGDHCSRPTEFRRLVGIQRVPVVHHARFLPVFLLLPMLVP